MASNVPTTPGLQQSVEALKTRPQIDNEVARERLLNEIGNRLELIRDAPAGELIDYPQEETELLELVERYAVAYHRDGYLILRDPADDVETLEP